MSDFIESLAKTDANLKLLRETDCSFFHHYLFPGQYTECALAFVKLLGFRYLFKKNNFNCEITCYLEQMCFS